MRLPRLATAFLLVAGLPAIAHAQQIGHEVSFVKPGAVVEKRDCPGRMEEKAVVTIGSIAADKRGSIFTGIAAGVVDQETSWKVSAKVQVADVHGIIGMIDADPDSNLILLRYCAEKP